MDLLLKNCIMLKIAIFGSKMPSKEEDEILNVFKIPAPVSDNCLSIHSYVLSFCKNM
ncbi:MAG: hypothetical protein GX121_04535 [Ignavibacteria bacterium]|nr:hypothetical protein [Ignavibacteria bacterium]